jgi:hypothetical protein
MLFGGTRREHLELVNKSDKLMPVISVVLL